MTGPSCMGTTQTQQISQKWNLTSHKFSVHCMSFKDEKMVHHLNTCTPVMLILADCITWASILVLTFGWMQVYRTEQPSSSVWKLWKIQILTCYTSSDSVSSTTRVIPLVKSSRFLDAGSEDVPKSCDGNVVLDAIFDSPMIAQSSPDHLITVQITDLYKCFFKAIMLDTYRRNVDVMTVHEMRINGLYTEGNMGNLWKDRKFDSLHCLKKTTLIAAFLFAAPIFLGVGLLFNDLPFSNLPTLMKDVVRKLYILPYSSICCRPQSKCFRHSEITDAAKLYWPSQTNSLDKSEKVQPA